MQRFFMPNFMSKVLCSHISMKVRTLGRMCILKHSILAIERAPNMYRTPSTSGEPLPAVRELSANCIAYVSMLGGHFQHIR